MCRGQLGNAAHTAPPPPPSAARSSPGWPLTLEVTDFCMETLPAMRLSRRSGGKILPSRRGRKEGENVSVEPRSEIERKFLFL